MFDMDLDSTRGLGKTSAAGPEGRWPLARSGSADSPSVLQRVLELCCEGTPFACKLSQELVRLRALYAVPDPSSPDPLDRSLGGSSNGCRTPDDGPAANGSRGSSPGIGACGGGGGGGSPRGAGSSTDVDGIARELLAEGYLIQLRDEAAVERPKDVRRCLQQLRHRFIVCIGARAAQMHAVPESCQWQHGGCGCAAAAAGGGGGQSPCVAGGDVVADAAAVIEIGGEEARYLPEPLVVEPCFRDQFVIAHATPTYEALLESLPLCFVGTVERLEKVVSLLCEEMAAALKAQGLTVPPWRSKQAMLSKWAPKQLLALSAKIAQLNNSTLPVTALPAAVVEARPVAAHLLLGAASAPAPMAGTPVPLGPLAAAGASTVTVAAPDAAVAVPVALAAHVREPAPPQVGAAAAVVVVAGLPALKFTRKASSEWKSGAAPSGKKVKSLLAAALRESGTPSGSPGSRRGASPAAPSPAPAGGPAIRTAPNHSGWGRINTVRWGAALEQDGQQQQQHVPLH